MKLRHFLVGKFTARDERIQGYHDSDVLSLHPSESIDFYLSLNSQLAPVIRALKPPRVGEQMGSNREAVLRLVIPRDANEWLYIRVFPGTPPDVAGREVTRYHAVLLTEKDICALEWRPWRLDPYLFTGIAADKVEGVLGGNTINLGDVRVPVEIDIDLQTLDEKSERVSFPDQLIGQIRTELNGGPVYITEQDDSLALMELIGEVANRLYYPETKDRIPSLAFGLRRVMASEEAITNYHLSLLPAQSNLTYTGLATVERGEGYFPIKGWTETWLPTTGNGQVVVPKDENESAELRERVSKLESSLGVWKNLGPNPEYVRNIIENLKAARNKEPVDTGQLQGLNKILEEKEKELRSWRLLEASPQAMENKIETLNHKINNLEIELRERSRPSNESGSLRVSPPAMNTRGYVPPQREALYRNRDRFLIIMVVIGWMLAIGFSAELIRHSSNSDTTGEAIDVEQAIINKNQEIKGLENKLSNSQKDLSDRQKQLSEQLQIVVKLQDALKACKDLNKSGKRP
jgi:hypothetical protein